MGNQGDREEGSIRWVKDGEGIIKMYMKIESLNVNGIELGLKKKQMNK